MNVTIKNRLRLSNLLTLVFVAAVGLIGYLAVADLERSMGAISTNGAAIKDQLQADQMHDALRADVLAALLAGPDGRAEAEKDTAGHAAEFRRLLAQMSARSTNASVKAAMDKVVPDAEAYLKRASEEVRLAVADPVAARAAQPAFMVQFRTLEKSMAELSELIEADSDATREEANRVVAQVRMQIIGMALAAMGITLTVGLFLARSITVPLEAAIRVADTIADGKLGIDIAVSARDRTETGRLTSALAAMRINLHQIVSQVHEATDSIALAVGDIAAGNSDLSGRTERQAGSLEETAASMEELNATVRQNAENAQQASHLAEAASGIALRGGEVVAQVVGTMGAIDEASRRIGDIIGTIESIAFQTNILALNAAVEAARAGEQGRGFAVVASEVRALAQRSDVAAKEIRQLVAASGATVSTGSRLVNEAGATMAEVVASVRRVSAIVSEISAAVREQEAGIALVNGAIIDIDGVTQQNATLVGEAAAAAAALEAQSDKLTDLVGVFDLGPQAMHGLQALAPARPAGERPAPASRAGGAALQLAAA